MTFVKNVMICAAMLGALGLVGCGDDDGGTTPDASAMTPDATAGDAMAMEDAGGACHDPATMLDLTVTDACQNADDQAATMSDDPDLGDLAADCGRSCFLAGRGTPDCVVACMRNMSSCVSSVGCTTCYALSVGCASDNCLTECLDPANGEACLACRCGANAAGLNCFDIYDSCRGETTMDACPSPMADGGMAAADAGM